ncbi:hypothetical protein BC828DRAFT_379716 [Blastocladiella britannica]|nr:hypothetical protein BC828DRAFT_379716 [Blastocladiella britannica]
MTLTEEPPLISNDVAINSYLAFSITLLLALSSLTRSATAIFPHSSARITAALLCDPPPDPTRRHRRAVFRDQILFTSALLLVIDSINKLMVCWQVHHTGTTNFVAYYFVDTLSIQNVMFLATTGVVHRCSVVIMTESKELRRRCLVIFNSMCLALCIEFQVVYLMSTMEMARIGVSGYEWMNSHVIPKWLWWQLALLPLITIFVSFWSLSVAFHTPILALPMQLSFRSLPREPSGKNANAGNSSGGGGGTEAAILGSARLESMQSLAGGGQGGTSSGPTGSRTSSAMVHVTSLTPPPPPTNHAAVGSKSVEVPLSRSFNFISAVVFVTYCIFIAGRLYFEESIPIMVGFWTTSALNLTTAAEISFDSVFRWNRANRGARRKGRPVPRHPKP